MYILHSFVTFVLLVSIIFLALTAIGRWLPSSVANAVHKEYMHTLQQRHKKSPAAGLSIMAGTTLTALTFIHIGWMNDAFLTIGIMGFYEILVWLAGGLVWGSGEQ